MLLKMQWKVLLISVIMMISASTASFPEYCSDCEEEIWEEIPCNQIPKTSTTTTTTAPAFNTTPSPITTTPTPETTTTSTTTRPRPTYTTDSSVALKNLYNSTTTNTSDNLTANNEAYNKCYCECKVGCREFCRKVPINKDASKGLTQVSKTIQEISHGHIETKHLHQHKFIPNVYNSERLSNGGGYADTVNPAHGRRQQEVAAYDIDESVAVSSTQNTYEPNRPLYGAAVPAAPPARYPSVNTANAYTDEIVEAPSYSINELKNILQAETEEINKFNYANPNTAPTYFSSNALPYATSPSSDSVAPNSDKNQLYNPVYFKVIKLKDDKGYPNIQQTTAPSPVEKLSGESYHYAIGNYIKNYGEHMNPPSLSSQTADVYNPYQPSFSI